MIFLKKKIKDQKVKTRRIGKLKNRYEVYELIKTKNETLKVEEKNKIERKRRQRN